ncbi:MAG: HAMP domain-containing sensor histidine kinase [Lachnospiraceae bacterium]|nr:HAMP domain-containing sensor histidine kinase [Lachnospiraceae bacterium]
MKHSIRRQMAVVFIGLVVSILVVFLSVNAFFLEQYYKVNKQKDLKKMYTTIEAALKKDTLTTDEVKVKLGQLVEKSNISFVVLDESGREVVWADRDAGSLKLQLMGYLLDKNETSDDAIESTDDFEIRKTTDPNKKLEYIEMWGHFSNNYSFIMRSPLEGIRESADISNRFLAYVGLVVVAISILLVWYFSKRITEPILELAELSEKMADLDFNAKYTSGGNNELGVLGSNFNTMSEKLQLAITELKTANNELQKDIEQKEQIETMRTEFLGNVSHELKTPIALIQGYSEGLKEGINGDAESREFYCDVIIDEANKMNQMVKSLLTLNQLEFGNDGLLMGRFDIVALTRGVLQSCDILVQQKDVKLNFIQEEPIYVWADEFKVEQVVRNYVSNALNHADNDKVIEVKVMKNGEKAHLSVFNTGMPIPEEDINRIWDKFYKVDKARTREYGGNGIGLSIVKAIMESFHQEYGVKNYDNGVEFWFELDAK